jgi:hypothetical protein
MSSFGIGRNSAGKRGPSSLAFTNQHRQSTLSIARFWKRPLRLLGSWAFGQHRLQQTQRARMTCLARECIAVQRALHTKAVVCNDLRPIAAN